MAQDLERLLVRIDATTESLRRELKRADQAISGSAAKFDKETGRISASMDKLGRVAGITGGALGGLGAALSARKIVQYADAWKTLEGRLRIVTDSSQELQRTQADLFKLAQDTRAPLEGITNLYARMAMAIGDNAKMQAKMLPVTELFSKALAITGESAASAQGAIVQFTQAIGSDFKNSSQELNSIIDQAPRVAKALADGMGVQVGQLKKLAQEGELSTERVINALVSQADVLSEEFAKMPRTVGQAFQELDNAFLKFIGQSDAISVGTNSIALAVHGLAENFDTLAKVGMTLSGVLAARMVPALVASTSAFIASEAAAIRQMIAFRGVNASALVMGATVMRTSVLMTGLATAMKAIPWLALAYGISQVVSGTDRAEEAQIRYNDALGTFRGKASEMASANSERRRKLEEDTNKIIEAHVRELESLQLLIDRYAEFGEGNWLERGWGALTMATGEVMGRLGIGDAPSEVMDQADRLRDTIKEMRGLLKEVEEGKQSANKAGGNDTAAKDMEKLLERQKKYREELELTIEQLGQLKAANDNSADSYARLKREIEAENEARQQGYKQGTKEFEQVKRLIIQREEFNATIDETNKRRDEEIRKAQETADELKRQQEAAAEAALQPWVHAFENVQDALADMLVEGKFSFEKLADIAKRLAAEVAAAWIIKPMLSTALLSAGVPVSGMSGASGAGGGFGIGDLASFGNMFASSTGAGASLTTGINSFGASLGFGGVTPEFVGPLLPGTGVGASAGSLTAASLSSVLGVAAIGALGGGILADAIGLNSTGGSIGGGAGAAIGFMAGGPIGAIIGGILGSVGGGLFGPDRPHPASTFGGTLGETGGFADVDYLSKHMDTQAAKSIGAAVQAFTQGLERVGINLDGTQLHGGINDGKGFLRIGDEGGFQVGFDPEDEDSLNKAIADLGVELARTADVANESLATALQNIQTEGRTADEVLSDIQFAAAFDKLGEPVEKLSAVEQAIKGITDAFDVMRETAERLGLAVERVNAAEEMALGEVRKGFREGIQSQLLGAIDPTLQRVYEENLRFQQQLADAEALGVGENVIARIKLLHETNLKAITQQTGALQEQVATARELASRFSRISDTFKNLLFDLQFGKFSPLSPADRLAALRGQVNTLGMQARLGDPAAAEELGQLLPEFVQLSGEINGFNTKFEADRKIAEELAIATKGVADRQLEIQNALLAEAEKQSSLLEQMVGGANVDFGNMNAHDIFKVARQSGKLSDMLAMSIAQSVGFTGAFGGGAARAFYEDNPDANRQALLIGKSLGLPGLAGGGFVTGGIPGMDSVPAMLMPGEAVLRARAVQSIGAGAVAAMNASGRLPANDNGLGQRIDRLTAVVESLVRVTAASGNTNAALLTGVKDDLGEIRDKVRLEASR